MLGHILPASFWAQSGVVSISVKTLDFPSYSRFQVTFQSPVSKFVLNIPNYITKLGILQEYFESQLHKLLN